MDSFPPPGQLLFHRPLTLALLGLARQNSVTRAPSCPAQSAIALLSSLVHLARCRLPNCPLITTIVLSAARLRLSRLDPIFVKRLLQTALGQLTTSCTSRLSHRHTSACQPNRNDAADTQMSSSDSGGLRWRCCLDVRICHLVEGLAFLCAGWLIPSPLGVDRPNNIHDPRQLGQSRFESSLSCPKRS